MEIQVQELIDKIKKDGIKTATEEANRIKAEADNEAKKLLESAKKEAADLIAQAKHDAERSEKAGIAALEQASRNLVLAFKDEITALLNKVISEKVSSNYNDDVLRDTLPQLIKTWAEKSGGNLDVILPEDTLNRLKDFFNEKLADEFLKGIELKPNRKFSSGFRISNKDGSAYYDFSSESVAQQLSAYLNPKLAGLLKEAVKGI